MIKILLKLTGWIVAHAPAAALKLLCAVLARLMLACMPRRHRLVFSNLHHAFPDRDDAWRRAIALESSRRLFETALLSLAAPFLSEPRIREIGEMSPELDRVYREHHERPFPLVIGTPHLAYWESLTWFGPSLSVPLPEMGVIFRPLKNPDLDAWVKTTRERHGMRLLSRKTGLQEAFKFLKRNSVVALLFDQNAGMQGALSTLLGRVCSTTELTGLLVERYGARLAIIFSRRLDFWKLRYELVEIAHDGTSAGVVLALNGWLEQALTNDPNLCASWLWSHDRWRNQDVPERRLRLEAKRNLLDEEARVRGWAAVPRKTRFWIRLPNWLGDAVMTLPLLRALRASRPDAEITLIAKPALLPLLSAAGVADRIEPLPSRESGYFRHFWRSRKLFPDTYIVFTHSFRGDLEAWLTRAPQRFGVVWPGKRRPLLTHAYAVPAGTDPEAHHQLTIWENFFRQFGLDGELDRRPPLRGSEESALAGSDRRAPRIGFIAGSENTPEKRWPVRHWRTLMIALSAEFPQATFVLFGTANDQPITREIGSGVGAHVIDLAGKTNLVELIEELRRCTVVVSNDTGGMHLANAVGVPLVALFGPTNSVRTGPVFSSPLALVRAPATGASRGNLAKLDPEIVLRDVRAFLPRD